MGNLTLQWASNCSEGKGKLFLCLIKHHKDISESGGTTPCILNLGTRLRQVISFTPQPLYPWKKHPGIHYRGSWLGPRAGLEAVKRAKPNSSVKSKVKLSL
jgi:hypothetical protein